MKLKNPWYEALGGGGSVGPEYEVEDRPVNTGKVRARGFTFYRRVGVGSILAVNAAGYVVTECGTVNGAMSQLRREGLL